MTSKDLTERIQNLQKQREQVFRDSNLDFETYNQINMSLNLIVEEEQKLKNLCLELDQLFDKAIQLKNAAASRKFAQESDNDLNTAMTKLAKGEEIIKSIQKTLQTIIEKRENRR